jgi:hypothetical protein
MKRMSDGFSLDDFNMIDMNAKKVLVALSKFKIHLSQRNCHPMIFTR